MHSVNLKLETSESVRHDTHCMVLQYIQKHNDICILQCSVVFIVGNTDIVLCTKERADLTMALLKQKSLITVIVIKVSYELID